MAKIKKVRKYREGGDIECPPGAGGKCRPVRMKGSSYSSESYKPGKTPKASKQDDIRSRILLESREAYERDFPGDVAPKGFEGGEDKKGTRWKTVPGKGIRYSGQAIKGKKGVKVVAKKAAVKKAVVKKQSKKK
jgi:hypothetical protein